MKRSALKSIGKRKLRKASRRREIVELVHARDQVCQFGIRPHPFKVADECRGPLDVHEIIPRSVWPDGDLDVTNTILLCRAHHSFVTDNPLIAHNLGLHGFSYERGNR